MEMEIENEFSPFITHFKIFLAIFSSLPDELCVIVRWVHTLGTLILHDSVEERVSKLHAQAPFPSTGKGWESLQNQDRESLGICGARS